MGHSKNFEKVKSFFENGLWTKERVYNVVGKKTGITGKEYEEITGVKYE